MKIHCSKKYPFGLVSAFFVTLPITVSANTEEPETLMAHMEVVTVSGYQQDISKAPGSVSVIEGYDLENKAYRDVAEVIQDLPGVFVSGGPGRKGGTTEVSIRGMSSAHVLILVDGKPRSTRQTYASGVGQGAEFDWLPPFGAIERIELVRGPMSSLYGSEALGGVINIITKESDHHWNGSLSTDVIIQDNTDSGDGQKLGYYLNGPLSDSLSMTINGSAYHRDEDEIPNGYTKMDNSHNVAKLDWDVSAAQSMGFEVGVGSQKSESTVNGRGADSEVETTRDSYSIDHNVNWGNASTRTFLQSEKVISTPLENEYQHQTLDSKTHSSLDVIDLVVGAQYRTQRTNQPLRGFNTSTISRWDAALFAEAQWNMSNEFSLTGGARVVEDEQYGTEVVPRLYAVYGLNENLTIKGGISKGYRTPDLTQGDSNWVEGGGGSRLDGATIGNSDLRPEYSDNFEISMEWQRGDNLSASASIYQTNFKDVFQKNAACIESSQGAYDCSYLGRDYQAILEIQNSDEAVIKGVETTISYGNTDFNIGVNYSYIESEITSGVNKEQPLNDQPNRSANLNGTLYVTEKLDLWSKVRYQSEAKALGSERIPSYSLADIGTMYRFGKGINLRVGIYNLLDKEISYESYGRVIDGRRYSLGISYDF